MKYKNTSIAQKEKECAREKGKENVVSLPNVLNRYNYGCNEASCRF